MAGLAWGGDLGEGYMGSADMDELSDILRFTLQPLAKMRQFVEPREADKPYHKGDKFFWNIYGDTSQPAPEELAETEVVPETDFQVTQSSLTIKEVAIAIPFTQKLEILAKHDLVSVVKKSLANNARKWFDAEVWKKFKSTPLVAVPTSGTSITALTIDTDGVTAVVNNIEFSKEHVNLMDDMMRERNIPPDMRTDTYIVTSHPTTFRPLRNDLETINAYTESGIARVFAGEIGRYSGMRFVEQTNIAKGGAEDSVTFNPFTGVSDPWDNAKSSWAFIFGDDTVLECVVCEEQVRARIPGDYGRAHGMAWYAMVGYGLTHTVAANARIFEWGSAS